MIAFVRIFADRNTDEVTCEIKDQRIQLTEVTGCQHISGADTFEIGVMATNLEACSRIAIQALINLSRVKYLHTSFLLGELKTSRGLPLGHLQRHLDDLFHHETPGFYLDAVVRALFNGSM